MDSVSEKKIWDKQGDGQADVLFEGFTNCLSIYK